MYNMYTAVYNCPDNIENFKIRVRIKQQRITIKLPNFVDNDNIENEDDTMCDVKIFSWQQKIFCDSEIKYYSDDRNCYTDLEKKYHDQIVNRGVKRNNVLFSYINGDDFSQNTEINCTNEIKPTISDLCQNMSNLRLRKTNKLSESLKFLKGASHKNIFRDSYPINDYETMFIVADLHSRESPDDIYIKSEYVICTLKYDHNNKTLIIFPDFSKSPDEPYLLEVDNDSRNIFHFWIENMSEDLSQDIKNNQLELATKLYERDEEIKQQRNNIEFILPTKNELHVYMFIEILTAKQFEYDNLYVQYRIDIPEHWIPADDKQLLNGATHSVKTKGTYDTAMIGYPFEVHLIYDMKNLDTFLGIPQTPTIYFEVISKDTWNRFRTEGFTYTNIPINDVGSHVMELPCILLQSKGPWADMQRFFVGGCTHLDDITWLNIPSDHKDGIVNKYGVPTSSTGFIEVKFNIVQQSKQFIKKEKRTSARHGYASSGHASATNLVRSVNQVLIAFKKARKNMIKARNKIILHTETETE